MRRLWYVIDLEKHFGSEFAPRRRDLRQQGLSLAEALNVLRRELYTAHGHHPSEWVTVRPPFDPERETQLPGVVYPSLRAARNECHLQRSARVPGAWVSINLFLTPHWGLNGYVGNAWSVEVIWDSTGCPVPVEENSRAY